MKFAVETATYFGQAILGLLDANGYKVSPFGMDSGDGDFVLVNTKKKTFKDADGHDDRTVYNPLTNWAAIAALVADANGGAQAPTPRHVGPTFRVGDRVTAVNGANTKPQFQLTQGFHYRVVNITASGKLNLGGPHDYLPGRFTMVTPVNSLGVAPYFDAVQVPVAALPTPAAVIPVDASGNPLRVGDSVLVTIPESSKPVFRLRTNGVAVITHITAKGALGFAFDDENTFLSKRFQKVTLDPVYEDGTTDARYGNVDVQSGDLVVARPGRHRRNPANAAKFALPIETALVFRGVTVDNGNFILDGYAEHAYAPARFSVVSPVFPG